MPTENSPIWIFLHLPKTGGTTFHGHLMRHLAWDREFIHLGPTGERYRKEKKLKPFAERPEEERQQARVLGGHHTEYGLHELVPKREPRYITILRDPAERLVSAYNFNMSAKPEKKRVSFKKWYKEKDRKNPMTRFFYRKFSAIAGDKGKRDAKQLLDQCWFVGITERLDQDFPLLFTAIGVPTDWTDQRVAGVNPADPAPLPGIKKVAPQKLISVDADIRKLVAEDHKKDLKLFEYAKELNSRQREKLLLG